MGTLDRCKEYMQGGTFKHSTDDLVSTNTWTKGTSDVAREIDNCSDPGEHLDPHSSTK